MKLNIMAFGIARDIFNSSIISINCEAHCTVANLTNLLTKQYPELLKLKSFAIAVNGIYANDNTLLQELDEIAIIPPVSGG